MRRDALSHPVAIAGALLTTVSAVLFVALIVAVLAGLLRNPYAGLVIFVALPAGVVAGLLLIPLGVWLRGRRLRRDPDAVTGWPVLDFRRATVRRTTLAVLALSAVNVVIVLLAGYGTLHWMESPGFCGQVCHAPMQPQFEAWKQGTHARIACVDCHVGEGAAAFLHAKLSGVRQLAHVAMRSYPRPIPPGAEMPAGTQAQTCAGCHQAERTRGDRIRVIREYADDEASSETATALQLHVGVGSPSGRAIHWHADPAIRVEYVASADRQTIPYVRVTRANGQVKEYVAADAAEGTVGAGERRTMDCVDCHNTVGHPIAQTAEQAVDAAVAAGLVSRRLPHARREGLRLVKATYATQDEAASAIDRGLRTFYDTFAETTDGREVARTTAALQDVYRRNVFPSMKVTWGAYPTNKGHLTSTGCFRCHDDSHKAKDGTAISADCDYCHKQLDGGVQ